MTKATPAQRVAELREVIEAANLAYHTHDDPIITDAEYDALKRELVALEVANPELQSPDSPTRKVGAAPAEGFEKIRHEMRMMSLSNAFEADDVTDFQAAIRSYLVLGSEATVAMTAEPRSMAYRLPCATRMAIWSLPPPAVMARLVRMSLKMPG